MGTRAQYLFLQADTEISEKRNFFVNCSVPENFQWENFSGIHPENPYALSIPKKNLKFFLDPVLVAQSWVSATKCGPLAQL